MRTMTHLLTDLTSFLETAPTAWHVVDQLSTQLAARNFSHLAEDERWKLEPGKKYFFSRGGALCAFCIPLEKPKKTIILASHTDSPCLKLKPQPVFRKENNSLFGVELYGSPLLSSWLNRDLCLAGKVVIVNHLNQVEEKLVFINDVRVFIPQLAIHLDREVNEKGLLLNKQDHLCPLIGLSDEAADPSAILESLIAKHVDFHSLICCELFLVPIDPPRFVGIQNEMIASSRLDNLASVHASAMALTSIESPSTQTLQMAMFYDHEEIGSQTKQGAQSPFLCNVLERIYSNLALDLEDQCALKHHSLCVSIDMAHALNPNYVQKHDPVHPPLMGKGIVLKYNANQKYATNATSAAAIIQACKQLNLQTQSYVSRSDMPCGSTVGPLIAAATGMNTVDIGCPQLSMHSIREAISCQDYLDLCRLLSFLVQEY